DYGYAILHLQDGRILVAGKADDQIGLARLLGDTNQDNASDNDAPENTVPQAIQETVIDTPLAFTAYQGNEISISDPDAGNQEVEMELSSTNGVVTLVNRNLVSTGLTYLTGDGLEDTTVRVRGKITEINTALSWVAFTPSSNFTGSASLTITTDDLGNSGTGGAKSDTDTVSVTVNSLGDFFDDPPTWKTYPGLLDESFDEDGRKQIDLGTSLKYDHIAQLTELPDGKIIAAGRIDNRIALFRFTADLQLDPTFGTDGYVKSSVSAHPGSATSLDIDSSGRLLVLGRGRLERYLPNGTLDTSFGSSGAVTTGSSSAYGYGITQQPDGRLVVATSTGIIRIPEDGSAYDGSISGSYRGVQVFPDGDILVIDHDSDVHRYSRDFILEQSYSNNFGTTYSTIALPDNRTLLIGSLDGNLSISRHLTSGEVDSSFGNNGHTSLPVLEGTDVGYNATLQSDGKILIVGSADTGANQDIAVARLTYDGDPDTSFFTGYNDATVSLAISPNGDDYGYAILHLQDGRILVAGKADDQIGLARLMGFYNPCSMDSIGNASGNEDTTGDIALTNLSAGEDDTQDFLVTAQPLTGSELFADLVVQHGNNAENGTLRVIPAADRHGTADLVVTIEDGGMDRNLATKHDNTSASSVFSYTIIPVNDIPSVDSITDKTLDVNAGNQTISLTNIDPGGNESQPLAVTASTTDSDLIANLAVQYSSPASTGILTFLPAADSTGTASISVRVEDGGLDQNLTTTDDNAHYIETFLISIGAENADPEIDAIDDLTIDEDAPEQTINLTGINAGPNENQALRVSVTSDNPTLIPNPAITYTSPNSTGSLSLTPVANEHGTATLSVSVEDAGLDGNLATTADNAIFSRTFIVSVNAVNDPPTLDALDNL
ncbi:MAG: hypothetical protein ACR2NF_08320, partial [Pirellulales bacterium]